MSHAKQLDMIIVIPPSSGMQAVFPPYGALTVAAALRENGFRVEILNVDTERISNDELVRRVAAAAPQFIGFSGIVAPSYHYIKEASRALRERLPRTVQILGGGLSSAAETILTKTAIDIVVYGEGEITAPELLKRLDARGDLASVEGIYYREGGTVRSTRPRALVRDLDALPRPAYDLIDMTPYLPDGIGFIRRFVKGPLDPRIEEIHRRRPKMMTVLSGRGCFGECSFCFRAYRGIRFHSMKHLFDDVEYCMEKFNAGFISFGDECFAANTKRHWEFIEEYKRRKSEFIFRFLGARVDTFDKEVLSAYREIGCWMIEYGFESGSQKMLDIMQKRVTVDENRQVALWMKEAGIYTTPTLVLGMPGETTETVRESISFLKSLELDYKQYQWTYALPIPGSPLYDFAKITGAINDDDRYLESLDGEVGRAGTFHVNLTAEPDEVVASWEDMVRDELDADYCVRRYHFGILASIMKTLVLIGFHIRKRDLFTVFSAKVGCHFGKTDTGRLTASTNGSCRFRSSAECFTNDIFQPRKEGDIGRMPGLKEINERLRRVSQSQVLKT